MKRILLALLLIASPCTAGTYYVSPSGSASWSACTSQSTPCAAATAMTNAAAGDTVLFLNGTYTVTQGTDYKIPALNPANSGTAGSPITFRSLNPLGAVVKGIGNGDDPAVSAMNYVQYLIGAYMRDYVVWDGFKLTARDLADTKDIYASSRFENATSSVLQNCELIGGSHDNQGTSNNVAVFIENSSYLTISGNKIHGFIETHNNENNGGFTGYYSNHITYTGNEIYNNSYGIRLKIDMDDCLITGNFIHDNYVGVYITSRQATHDSERNTITNNVIVNNSYEAIELPAQTDQTPLASEDDTVIYNNTIYNNPVAIEMGQTKTGHYPKIYNNIIGAASSSMLNIKGVANMLAECDHNLWVSPFKIVTHKYETNSATYTTLAAWQASTELDGGGHPGSGDLNTSPLFANSSGTLTTLADFTLASNSPAKLAGRNGADIGAGGSPTPTHRSLIGRLSGRIR